MTNKRRNKFEDLVNKLREIRKLMKQEEIACDFEENRTEGNRVLIISENQAPEYLGPEFKIGSVDILPESHKDPNIKNIMDILPDLKIIRIRSI